MVYQLRWIFRKKAYLTPGHPRNEDWGEGEEFTILLHAS